MLKIRTDIKVTASDEAQRKIEEDLKLSQPTDEEGKKIIGSIINEGKQDESDD